MTVVNCGAGGGDLHSGLAIQLQRETGTVEPLNKDIFRGGGGNQPLTFVLCREAVLFQR